MTPPNFNPEKLPTPLSELEFKQGARTFGIREDEATFLFEHLERIPSLAELAVISALWSEHCSYKSSKHLLKRLPSEGDHVVQGPGENAGVVRFSGSTCIAFKMESHNHPSFIEPFHGAATGVGGILRDVFCMGARPVAVGNFLRFGTGGKRLAELQSEIVRGISFYGNCFGVPTICGEVSSHASYDKNPLVNAMAVGVVEESDIFLGIAEQVGAKLLYIGSPTGKDGIQGAIMASANFDEEGGERGTVQVGDPFFGKKLLEATLELVQKKLVYALQDMGAAGLTSSSVEMAERGKAGVFLDLDRIPLRTQKMDAWEILLSETQERMLLVVDPENIPAIEKLLDKWEIECEEIGEVIADERFIVWHRGTQQVNVPIHLASTPPPKSFPSLAKSDPSQDRPESYLEASEQCAQKIRQQSKDAWFGKMAESFPKKVDQSSIWQTYDRTIGTRTIFASEQGGAALLYMENNEALAITGGCVDRLGLVDPFYAGAESVLRSFRKLACLGAKPLGLTDCLNFADPNQEPIYRQLSNAIDGIAATCENLSIPVVSGNVSLYNQTESTPILPTPMIGMVGKVDDWKKSRPSTILEIPPEKDLWIYRLGEGKPFFDPYYLETNGVRHEPSSLEKPDFDVERELAEVLATLLKEELIVGARDVTELGLLYALCGSLPRAKIALSALDWEDLFRCGHGSYVIFSYDTELERHGLKKLGKATQQATFSLSTAKVQIDEHDLIFLQKEGSSVE